MYMHVYIGISSRILQWSVFYLVNVLFCVTNLNVLAILLKTKRRKSTVFAFNIQIPNQVE